MVRLERRSSLCVTLSELRCQKIFRKYTFKFTLAWTEIHLMKGANDEDIQKEREILLMLLKGTKDAKEKAKLKEPDLHNRIERIWQLRTRHLVQVFYLKCCYQRECIHPACKAEAYDRNSDIWYPGDPHWIIFHHQRLTRIGLTETKVVKNVLDFAQDTT